MSEKGLSKEKRKSEQLDAINKVAAEYASTKSEAKKENLLSKVALLPYSDNDYIVNILSGEDFPSKNAASSILPHISTFRRAIPLEMSAGSQFNKEK